MNYDLELLDTYKTILEEFKQSQPEVKSVCIAGGALRDMLLDKPIKDIDIFYHGTLSKENIKTLFQNKKENKNSLIESIKKKFGVFDLSEESIDDLIEAYGESTFKVPYQELYYKDVKTPIQLIEVKDSSDINKWINEDFGCNISKVMFDIQGLLLTKEFILHSTLQIHTFKNDCSPSYQNKIIAKVPEHPCNGLGGNNSLEW